MAKGLIPSVSSTEKIFTPTNSAMIALAIKNDPSMRNNIVRLDSRMCGIGYWFIGYELFIEGYALI
jgi:hypothetical protein